MGTTVASVLLLVAAFFAVRIITPDRLGLFWAILGGMIAGTLIGFVTQYYTAAEYKPTQGIAKAATTGPATVIIEGLV